MNHFTRIAVLFCLLVTAGLGRCSAQEWTRFRGPNGTGISTAKTIPTQWSETNYNWKTALPGAGHSSPVLWGDKVFVTAADSATKKITEVCVNAATGKILWQESFPFALHDKNDHNTFASGTPAVDEHRVYFCWNDPAHYLLVAMTHDGNKVWEHDLGPYVSQHGGGNSPVVYNDEVILGNEQDGDGFIIAVDSATGKTRWQTPRKSTEAIYSTPCVFDPHGDHPLLIFLSHLNGVSALNPGTGAIEWEVPHVFDKRVVASPVIAAGLIIGACGSGGGGNYVAAVRPGDPAKQTQPAIAYRITHSSPYVPTSVCVENRLFLWSDGGIVSCVDASTGEIRWQERVGGNYFSSPVWVDGRLFGISTRGEVVVLDAGDKFQVLARNSLNEATESTPAIAQGRMYIHTLNHLVSVGGGKTGVPPIP